LTVYDYLNDRTTKAERDRLDVEFEKIKDGFKHQIYRYRDLVIFHILVPSSKPGDTNYDVILQIKLANQHEGYGKIDQCELHVFSNCPSFVFKLAYLMSDRRLVPNWLLDKYEYETLAYAPKTKPENDFEKSLYFAMKYVHDNGLDNNSVYKTTGKTVNFLSQIADGVRTQKEILNQSKERIEQQRELRKKANQTTIQDNTQEERSVRKVRVRVNDRTVKTTHTSKKIGQIPPSGKVKTVKISKETKRF